MVTFKQEPQTTKAHCYVQERGCSSTSRPGSAVRRLRRALLKSHAPVLSGWAHGCSSEQLSNWMQSLRSFLKVENLRDDFTQNQSPGKRHVGSLLNSKPDRPRPSLKQLRVKQVERDGTVLLRTLGALFSPVFFHFDTQESS